VTDNEMVEWHHQLNGHEFKQAPEDREGQGRLACHSPRVCKESGTTEQLNKCKILVIQCTLMLLRRTILVFSLFHVRII